MNPANDASTMIGEILYYEQSNCIKREPEDIAFYNEGILETASTNIENTHPQLNEVKTEVTNAEVPNEDVGHSENLVGQAIVDVVVVPKQELVGEAVDFAEDTKLFQGNDCISIIAEPNKENEKVYISLIGNTPTKKIQNDKDFYIQQSNSESHLMYKCNMCPNPHFFKSNYLENPHKTPQPAPPAKNGRPKKFKCEAPGCEYKTTCRTKLADHSNIHSDKKYKCDECEFTTKSEKYLRNHKDAIHNPNLQRFFCEQCSFNSISQKRLREHEMLHKDPVLRETFKCRFEGCPFETKSKKSLYQHSIVHKDPSKIKSLKCPSCSYETIFKHCLQSHSLKHKTHKLRETLYCFHCPYKTVLKFYLIKHMLTHTKEEALEMFKCSQCSYKSKRKENLSQHMVKHSDVEMLKCFSCGFETKRKHTLRNHMATHK